ncbi:unnamed protein product [Ostreobium quekettii]|uniref:Uncharacterized protein n=1 Tax=Ostreobium quekettii TaxID=121088 RepID=A0A8S1IXZ4_9CHLO|nr:unnamed protein product [Ostreobium quekettii]
MCDGADGTGHDLWVTVRVAMLVGAVGQDSMGWIDPAPLQTRGQELCTPHAPPRDVGGFRVMALEANNGGCGARGKEGSVALGMNVPWTTHTCAQSTASESACRPRLCTFGGLGEVETGMAETGIAGKERAVRCCCGGRATARTRRYGGLDNVR